MLDSIYKIRIAIAPKRREINLLILDVDNLLVPSLIFNLQTLPIKGCHNLGIERLSLRSGNLLFQEFNLRTEVRMKRLILRRDNSFIPRINVRAKLKDFFTSAGFHTASWSLSHTRPPWRAKSLRTYNVLTWHT